MKKIEQPPFSGPSAQKAIRAADRILRLGVSVGVACWGVYLLVFGSDAGITIGTLFIVAYGAGALILLWGLATVVHLLAFRGNPERRSLGRLLVEPVAVLVCVALTLSGGSFRVRFLLSKPSLDRFVQQEAPAISSGEVARGARAGLFHVREAEMLPGGIVRLITTDCMFDQCGMVYSPKGTPPRIGEDYYSALGWSWWHWVRSW